MLKELGSAHVAVAIFRKCNLPHSMAGSMFRRMPWGVLVRMGNLALGLGRFFQCSGV